MKRLRLITPAALLCAILGGCGTPAAPPSTTLSYSDLFSSATLASPVMDSAFAMPANAAAPTDIFEGSLALGNTAGNGSVVVLRDDYGTFNEGDSPWKHLAAFSFEPGNVWLQSDDSGYSRASFPFALIQRNQNCVHNGEMTFLFSNSLTPNISNVRYQITQETCDLMKFNMWGQIAATYTPNLVANAATIKTIMKPRLPIACRPNLKSAYVLPHPCVQSSQDSLGNPSALSTGSREYPCPSASRPSCHCRSRRASAYSRCARERAGGRGSSSTGSAAVRGWQVSYKDSVPWSVDSEQCSSPHRALICLSSIMRDESIILPCVISEFTVH